MKNNKKLKSEDETKKLKEENDKLKKQINDMKEQHKKDCDPNFYMYH